MALTKRQLAVAKINQQVKVNQVRIMREAADFIQSQHRKGRAGVCIDDLCHEQYGFLATRIHKIVHLLGIEADISLQKPFIYIYFKE